MQGKTRHLGTSSWLLLGAAAWCICVASEAEAQHRRAPRLPSVEVNLEVLATLRSDEQQRERDEQYAVSVGEVDARDTPAPPTGRALNWRDEDAAPLPPSVAEHIPDRDMMETAEPPEWIMPEDETQEPVQVDRRVAKKMPDIEPLPVPSRAPIQAESPKKKPIALAGDVQKPEKPAAKEMAEKSVESADGKTGSERSFLSKIGSAVSSTIGLSDADDEAPAQETAMPVVESQPMQASSAPAEILMMPGEERQAAPEVAAPIPAVLPAESTASTQVAASNEAGVPALPEDVQRWLEDDSDLPSRPPANRGKTITPMTDDKPFPDLVDIPESSSAPKVQAAPKQAASADRMPWDALSPDANTPVQSAQPVQSPVAPVPQKIAAAGQPEPAVDALEERIAALEASLREKELAKQQAAAAKAAAPVMRSETVMQPLPSHSQAKSAAPAQPVPESTIVYTAKEHPPVARVPVQPMPRPEPMPPVSSSPERAFANRIAALAKLTPENKHPEIYPPVDPVPAVPVAPVVPAAPKAPPVAKAEVIRQPLPASKKEAPKPKPAKPVQKPTPPAPKPQPVKPPKIESLKPLEEMAPPKVVAKPEPKVEPVKPKPLPSKEELVLPPPELREPAPAPKMKEAPKPLPPKVEKPKPEEKPAFLAFPDDDMEMPPLELPPEKPAVKPPVVKEAPKAPAPPPQVKKQPVEAVEEKEDFAEMEALLAQPAPPAEPAPMPQKPIVPILEPTPEPQPMPVPPQAVKQIEPVKPAPAPRPAEVENQGEEGGIFSGLTSTFSNLLTTKEPTAKAPVPAPVAPAAPMPSNLSPNVNPLPAELPGSPTAQAPNPVQPARDLPPMDRLSKEASADDFKDEIFDRKQPKPVDKSKLIDASKAVPFGEVKQQPLLDIPADIADIDLDAPLPISEEYEVVEKDNKPVQKAPQKAEMELAMLPTESKEPAKAMVKTPSLQPGVSLQIVYSTDNTDVPEAMKAKLKKLAADAKRDNRRIILTSYASGQDDEAQVANRISLSRSLKLRGFLITEGVAKEKIIPKSMGLKNEGGPADRADIVLE